ncbi:MAG: tetratricopeptide repeat protein [Sphingobacteriaceae bacterium]|nr:tetratricopeptide repeat protein [Cytophagaceae bacterium]
MKSERFDAVKRVLLFLTILLLTAHLSLGQDAKALLDEGLKRAQVGDLQGAIKLFDQSVVLKDDYPVRQSRGTAKSLLKDYESAVEDFTKAIQFNPKAKKAYLNRGIARKKLADYKTAQADFDAALKLDPRYADALYNRGLLLELLSQREKACADFKAARAAGMEMAEPKVQACSEEPVPPTPNRQPLLKLGEVAADPKYGFTKTTPVKVGVGANSDTENIETYLDLLRDAQSKPLKYRKTASAPFFSKNAPGGKGTVDAYELRYLDASGQEKRKTVYLTRYEFEEPLVVYGFKTV